MGLTISSQEKLTEEELGFVSESWAIIMENPEENGVSIFKTFLERHNYYSYFEKFKGIPIEDLPQSRVFRNHALAIIRALNHLTENLKDEEKLRSLLFELGQQHGKRKITEGQFNELKAVILDILESVFKLPEKYLKAWGKTLDIGFAYIYCGLNETK